MISLKPTEMVDWNLDNGSTRLWWLARIIRLRRADVGVCGQVPDVVSVTATCIGNR